MTQDEFDGALSYATNLASALWEKHWKAASPDWKPSPDLIGVLTQIDNMTAGLVRIASQEELKALRGAMRERIMVDAAQRAAQVEPDLARMLDLAKHLGQPLDLRKIV